MQAHIASEHPDRIEDLARLTITKTTEQVAWVLEHVPAARQNDGVLIERCMRYWPFLNTRIIYDPTTQHLSLDAPYEDFIDAMRHIGSITRIGRHIRSRHKEWGYQSHIGAEREIEFQFSKMYWGQNKVL